MRVTVDLDKKDWFEVMMRYFTLKRIAGNCYVRKSSTKGYHLKAHGLKITLKELYFLRLVLGDDPNRVKLDSLRMKPKNTLWTGKSGKRAGEWKNDIFEVIGGFYPVELFYLYPYWRAKKNENNRR